MSYIEELLKNKSVESENILYKQWLAAKDYVPQVLNTVQQFFPHYSLHDASHSEAILTNIERVLGRQFLESLPVTDLWLLLSAAYYHDCGMAVFDKDVAGALKDKEFVKMVREFQLDASSPLHRYAKLYKCETDHLETASAVVTPESFESLKYLLAEYFRKKHASRSDAFLNDDISINLPGNPIPQRLITSLGQICLAHARDFDFVMAMPYDANGVVSGDFCHPRFVACMLRLGDLLDLDNNRFSDVLLKTLTSMPADSWQHYYKHLSTSHYLVSNRRIEITATCNEIEVAEKAEQWFGWIIQEMHDLQSHWSDIMPITGVATTLPSLGDIRVELKGYEPIDGKNITKFKLDTGRAMKLLQGSNLYVNRFDCIRELLQNATDAIYLRIFTEWEYEHSNETIADNDEQLRRFIKKCKKHKIRFKIDKRDKVPDNEDMRRYTVTIEDDGIGISTKTLKYMIDTGTGSQNAEKRLLIDRMPKFMRPSGCFGIGFQSVFQLTDKVHIVSRHLDATQAIEVDLYDPQGPKKGGVYMKLDSTKRLPGTTMTFEVELLERDYWGAKNDFVDKNDKSTSAVLDKVKSAVEEFRNNSWVPIYLNGETHKYQTFADRHSWYCATTGIQIFLNMFRENSVCNVYFRNQSRNGIRIPFLGMDANLLDNNASDYLQMNRKDLKKGAKDKIRRAIMATLHEYFTTQQCAEDLKPVASLFYHSYGKTHGQAKPDYAEEWKNHELEWWYEEVSLGALYDDIIKHDVAVFGRFVANVLKKGGLYYNDRVDWNEFSALFLIHQLYQHHYEEFAYLGTSDLPDGSSIVLYNGGKPDFANIENMRAWNNPDYKRGFLPCKEDDPLRVVYDDDMDNRLLMFKYESFPMTSYMLSPYLIEWTEDSRNYSIVFSHYRWDDKEGALYDWVFEHRYNKSVTKEQIKAAYAKYKRKMNPLLRLKPKSDTDK